MVDGFHEEEESGIGDGRRGDKGVERLVAIAAPCCQLLGQESEKEQEYGSQGNNDEEGSVALDVSATGANYRDSGTSMGR